MRIIRRYSNRKLYDTGTKKYITLDEIKKYLDLGITFKVINKDNGLDITLSTVIKSFGNGIPDDVTTLIAFLSKGATNEDTTNCINCTCNSSVQHAPHKTRIQKSTKEEIKYHKYNGAPKGKMRS